VAQGIEVISQANNQMSRSETLALQLLGMLPLPSGPTDHVIPSYLVPTYQRTYIIDELSDSHMNDSLSIAAILRSAFTAGEADIRERAVEALYKSPWTGSEIALIALAFDEDPDVRLTALEALLIRGSPAASQVANVLTRDGDDQVRETANAILAGGQVLYHKLP
jgi:hypothetical protein